MNRVTRFKRMLKLLSTLAVLAPVPAALAGEGEALLVLDGELPTEPGVAVTAPLYFMAGGSPIVAMAFSLDLDLDRLGFDPTDADEDGIPDAVTFPQGTAAVTSVQFDASDSDGELDVLLANLSGPPLPEGLLLEIELLPTTNSFVSTWTRFSGNPPASFGDEQGQAVAGMAIVLGPLFVDGFESGDLAAWAAVVP